MAATIEVPTITGKSFEAVGNSYTTTAWFCGTCGIWVSDGHLCQPLFSPWYTGGYFPPVQATPHKCPCCDGWGKRREPTETTAAYSEVACPACNGTGVVWR